MAGLRPSGIFPAGKKNLTKSFFVIILILSENTPLTGSFPAEGEGVFVSVDRFSGNSQRGLEPLRTQDRITILSVEQNLKHALSISHYAYVLENGRIVLDGTSEVIMANEYTKKAYLGM
jgi:hypothetical protein